MTSLERAGHRLGISVLIGSAVVAGQLLCSAALAEGSFFKDRPGSAGAPAAANTASPVVTPAPPAPAAPAAPPSPDAQVSRAGSAVPAPTAQPQPPLSPRATERPTESAGTAGSATLSGPVSDVLSTDTFVVNGQQVQLAGIRGRPVMLNGLKAWIQSNGGRLACRAVGSKYHCVTPTNKDVGMVVLANGAGEVDAGAPPAYRQVETQAQMSHKGIWAQR